MGRICHFGTGICFVLLCVAATASCLIVSQAAWAEVADLEKELQASLDQSGKQASLAAGKLERRLDASTEIARLRSLSENIRITHLLLEERYRLREERVQTLGSSAISRQQAMAEAYRKTIQEYLEIVETLPPTVSDPLSAINKLKALLDKLAPKKHHPIIGSLPYKHLNLPSRQPSTAPEIVPAYKGGDKTVSAEDTKSTETMPISKSIAELAQSMKWQPVALYEYVKNTIETDWGYWGCMKTPEETLRQKSGNDCDQALLLTSLLRAAGFPARIVQGNIEFFATSGDPIERVKNLIGIDDPVKIAEFLQKAGVPFRPLIAGGRIANFEIEHIYVESLIPYANYRGNVIDEHGKVWLGLDTSIKTEDYVYSNAKDLFGEQGAAAILTGLRNEYLSALQILTPLEYLKDKINQFGPYTDFIGSRTLPQESLKFLPASLQFKMNKTVGEYTSLPDALLHKVKFTAVNPQLVQGNELFSVTLPLSRLGNQQIAITYEPETVQDQEIIDTYGGLDNTPAYLVRLRPVLTINQERIVVAQDGLPMGSEYDLRVELTGPVADQAPEKIVNRLFAGNLTVIGISGGKAVPLPAPGDESGKNAERLLYDEAMNYILRWNGSEDELAALFHLALARPLPAVVTVGAVLDVTYLLDMPHGITWKGLYFDADLRSIEAVSRTQDSGDRTKLFMQFSSLQGSILENKLFEDDFKVESISTAKLMQLVNVQQSAIGAQLITIDKSNIDTILPTLDLGDNVKEDIRNSVNQNFVIQLPSLNNLPLATYDYENWTGIGYIKEKAETGESGWMLSGMIAGGMTVWSDDRWPQYYQNTLQQSYSDPPNYDPTSARHIQKVAASDLKQGMAGDPLGTPLLVKVTDQAHHPVANVFVTFTVRAGGGNFNNGATIMTAPTNSQGIASASLVLGKYTKDNPVFWWYINDPLAPKPYPDQVGENIVDAYITSAGAAIPTPFAAYGLPRTGPDIPYRVKKLYGDDLKNTILFFSGFVSLIAEDEYGNPIANLPLNIVVKDAVIDQNPPNCGTPPHYYTSSKKAYFIRLTEPCVFQAPVWGSACGSIEDSNIILPTTHLGSQAGVVLGGTPDAKYEIEAKCAPGANCLFYEWTCPQGQPCGYQMVSDTKLTFAHHAGYSCGETMLHLQSINITDTEGFLVNAQKVVDPPAAPLTYRAMAKLYALSNGEIITSLETPTVMFNGTPETGIFDGIAGTSAGDGFFTADVPVTKVGFNWIKIMGKASLGGYLMGEGPIYTPVFGVKIAMDPVPVIVTEGQGYAVQDTEIKYTILPAAPDPTPYWASSAVVFIYKSDSSGDVLIEAIRTERTGAGKATIARGFKFDPDKIYKAQVVLNYGGKSEIKGDNIVIPVAQIRVLTDESAPKDADEIKFGDGSKANKRYKLEMKSVALQPACNNGVGGMSGTIRSVTSSGQTVNSPGSGYYAATYNLDFTPGNGNCMIGIKDSSLLKDKFIVSNMSTATLDARIAELQSQNIEVDLNTISVLYGGLGSKLQLTVNGMTKAIPIEPVGVIVLGIDGLRQDVLYPDTLDSVQDGGQYRVDISSLSGLRQVLAGYDQPTEKQQYIMLPGVTTIFPSITYAAWASIFTGRQPSEPGIDEQGLVVNNGTGILGNEFFARDLYDPATPNSNTVIPGLDALPSGMVTLDPDGGALRAAPAEGIKLKLLNIANESAPLALGHVMPAEFLGFDTLNKKLNTSAPRAALKARPLWQDINDVVSKKYQVNIAERCDKSVYECRTVSMFNQYVNGVDWWGTPSFKWKYLWEALTGGPLFDTASTSETVDFVNHYFDNPAPNGKRKRFPALFSVYLPGLDHDAHITGMSNYKAFFENTVDAKVREIVKALKDQDEFDNKIFIVVSDHGETAMPTDLKYVPSDSVTGDAVKIDMSCRLDAKHFYLKEYREDERANNNLHIWELGEMFMAIGKADGTPYKVLAPQPIVDLNAKYDLPYGATATIDKANVIAALNGPMGHIYLKGANGWSDEKPDIVQLSKLAQDIRNYLMDGGTYIDKEARKQFSHLLSSVDHILIRVDGVYKDFNGVHLDANDNVIGPNAATINALYFDSGVYVSAFERIDKMNHLKRSGDIVLIMRDSATGAAAERFSTSYACKAWHGSLNRSDSYVPLIVAYPSGNIAEIKPFIDSTQGCNSTTGCDGNSSVSGLIKTIVQKQFGAQ